MKKIIIGILVLIALLGAFYFFNNKNQQFSQIVKNNDLCEDVSDRINKRACYIDEAIKTNEPSLCNMLPYTQEEFNQLTSAPIYQHSDITDCYRKIAKALKKPEVCEQIDKFDRPLGTILKDCKSSALE